MARRRKGRAINGWLVIDKPLGVTSTDVVNRVRRKLDARKVGHGGTLDPLATGLLPLAFGEATKTVAYVMEGDKTYRFTLRWGIATTTDDAEGEVVATSDIRPDRAAIEAVLPEFQGLVSQVPPAFSAIKVDGQRAYDIRSTPTFILVSTTARQKKKQNKPNSNKPVATQRWRASGLVKKDQLRRVLEREGAQPQAG